MSSLGYPQWVLVLAGNMCNFRVFNFVAIVLGLAVLELVISNGACVPVFRENEQNFHEFSKENSISESSNDVTGGRFARFASWRNFFFGGPEHKHFDDQFESGRDYNSIPEDFHHGPHGYPHKHGPWHNHHPYDDCDHSSDERPRREDDNDEESNVKPITTIKPTTVDDSTTKSSVATTEPSTSTTSEVPKIDIRFGGVNENEKESRIYFPESDDE